MCVDAIHRTPQIPSTAGDSPGPSRPTTASNCQHKNDADHSRPYESRLYLSGTRVSCMAIVFGSLALAPRHNRGRKYIDLGLTGQIRLRT